MVSVWEPELLSLLRLSAPHTLENWAEKALFPRWPILTVLMSSAESVALVPALELLVAGVTPCMAIYCSERGETWCKAVVQRCLLFR